MQWRKPSLNFKLVVLGCLSVGKTSLVTRYCQGRFSDGVLPTTGAAFFSRTNHFHDTEVTLSFWDTAGQERFKSVIPSVINGSEGLVLVYDRTSFQSFEGLADYLRLFREKVDCGNGIRIPVLLLGNKSDSNNICVSDETVRDWMENNEIGLSHYVSAKTGQGIERAFNEITEAMMRAVAMVRVPRLPILIEQTQSGCC
jgi:small GTP-binding protein